MHEARGQSPALHKTRHGGACLNPCTHELEVGRSEVQNHPQTNREWVEDQPGLYEMVSQNNHDIMTTIINIFFFADNQLTHWGKKFLIAILISKDQLLSQYSPVIMVIWEPSSIRTEPFPGGMLVVVTCRWSWRKTEASGQLRWGSYRIMTIAWVLSVPQMSMW